MRSFFYLCYLLMLLYFGCAKTLNINDINALSRVKFEKPSLQPDRELFDLRVDIIRQTADDFRGDSIVGKRDLPYHYLGFSLGNGIFYDLNGNLSIRVDYLLNMETTGDFKIEKTYRKSKANCMYQSQDGNFSFGLTNKNKRHKVFQVQSFDDSLAISINDKFRNAIVIGDTLTKFMNKKKVLVEIFKDGEKSYIQKIGKKVKHYIVDDDSIILGNTYKITQNQRGDMIQILLIGKKSDKLLYTIVRDSASMFIYDDKYYGKKLTFGSDQFNVHESNEMDFGFRGVN